MKTLRYYAMPAGKLVQRSMSIPDEDDLTVPHVFGTLSMNADPLRDLPPNLTAKFEPGTPFMVALDEIRHFLCVIQKMYEL